MSAHGEVAAYPSLRRENRRLGHIPGDYGLPVLGHTLEFVRHPARLSARMYRKYGPVYRSEVLFQRGVALMSAEGNRFVLRDREGNFSSYLGWQPVLGRLFPRGLMLRDGDDHRYQRRIMQAAFRKEALAEYVDRMNPGIASGIAAWRDRDRLRFYPAIKQLTLDLAATVFLGLQLGPEAERVNRAFMDTVRASIAVVRLPLPGLAWDRGLRGRRFLEDFLRDLIPAKRAGGGADFFSQICRARSEDGEAYDDREIVDHMIFLMMAAHDTTTSALTTMIHALGEHPEWQERVREELRSVGGDRLGYEELDRLELTGRVFREALRMNPPLPSMPRRTVRDCEFQGYRIPANTLVSISPSFTHHFSGYWREPQRFDPERFSRERAEHRQTPFAWIPFGGGAHMCIGLHFAEMQVKAFLHQFLRRYRVHLPADYRPRYAIVPISRPRDGLPVTLEPLDG
ncbi:MAG TPA: cytochrome P450 [Gammaproteobacteria bacterium]|nr:cytochrome P450 [Gammaproteobacteria bacterium]